MISVLRTITVNEELVSLFGKIDEEKRSIEFNYEVFNRTSIKLSLDVKSYIPKDITVFDMNAQQYTLYGCEFLSSKVSYTRQGVGIICGTFHRLIKENEISKKYDIVAFSFQGIEKFFPLENFKTQYNMEDGSFTFSKSKDMVKEYTLYGNTKCFVSSRFSGVIESDELYELDVKQNKVINLRCDTEKTIDELLSLVEKTKKYFEFILKQEILLDNVVFANSSRIYRISNLVCDDILIPKTFVKNVKDNPYIGTTDELFLGLDGWLSHYDKYENVIKLWQKIIYNTNVSKEDLFIWRCQSFELLCTINEEIYDKAFSLKSIKQEYPNLKNFLKASNDLYDLFNGLDERYFRDVKNVRDKLTHNNPKKSVTYSQKENSYNLIEFFLIKTLCETIKIKGVDSNVLFLTPLT